MKNGFLLFKLILILVITLSSLVTNALDIERSSRFDRWERVRKQRSRTQFIIVHTTEAGNQSSYNSINGAGSANYLIMANGKVYHIVHHSRTANHAGKSMWNGVKHLNNKSVGIEFVGYHYKSLTDSQIRAGKELIRQLQDIYNVPDRKVLTHSMVAYGVFNRVSFRGRKDCALNMANDQTRFQMGLAPAPKDDPDVPSRISGWDIHHQYMPSYLYGDMSYYSFGNFSTRTEFVTSTKSPSQRVSPEERNTISRDRTAWTIARGSYNEPTTIYTYPSGKVFRGDEINNWGAVPIGTKVSFIDCSNESTPCVASNDEPQQDREDARPDLFEIGRDGATAWAVAQNAYNNRNTLYLIPTTGKLYYIISGADLESSKRYDINRLPRGTKVLLNYVYGGKVTARRSPITIVGSHWDSPSTLYYNQSSGDMVYGDSDDLEPRRIPRNTIVLFKDRFSVN